MCVEIKVSCSLSSMLTQLNSASRKRVIKLRVGLLKKFQISKKEINHGDPRVEERYKFMIAA